MSMTFTAGQTALSSGVYKAVHANNRIAPHYVLALHGDTFPN